MVNVIVEIDDVVRILRKRCEDGKDTYFCTQRQ